MSDTHDWMFDVSQSQTFLHEIESIQAAAWQGDEKSGSPTHSTEGWETWLGDDRTGWQVRKIRSRCVRNCKAHIISSAIKSIKCHD